MYRRAAGYSSSMPAVQAALPPGKVHPLGQRLDCRRRTRRIAPLYVLDARPIITGEYLTDAKPNQTPDRGHRRRVHAEQRRRPPVPRETAKHVRDYMAIVLDERVMGRPPVIKSAIGTRGQITMGQGRDLQEAQDLALVLRAGALPVPLKVAEVRNIGASLGQDSINQGIAAGAIGDRARHR